MSRELIAATATETFEKAVLTPQGGHSKRPLRHSPGSTRMVAFCPEVFAALKPPANGSKSLSG